MNKLYWLIPVLLIIPQLIFIQNSLWQIRYEEIADSTRNIYWLLNRTVYDGMSTNIGWDSLLLFTYTIFGFSIFTAKYVRLALHLVSLFSLVALLKNYLGVKKALIPLITIALSPTLLWFNTIGSQYGIDLAYLMILLYLISLIKFNNSWIDHLINAGFWALAMFAAMSFPTSLFFLPVLIMIYIWKIRKVKDNKSNFKIKYFLISLIAFFLPLMVVFFYEQNRELLIYDPEKNSGIFRSGGGTFLGQPNTITTNLSNLLTDLFNKGVSYNFEVNQADFSLIFPIISVIVVFFIGSLLAIRKNNWRTPIIFAWCMFFFNLMVYMLIFDLTGLPGIRRATGMLAVFYFFFVASWNYLWIKKRLNPLLKWSAIAILMLIPLHHMIVYPLNLSNLSTPSPFRETLWFVIKETPDASFNYLLDILLKEDIKLMCPQEYYDIGICRYGEIYSALASACHFNHLKCHNILGFDPNTRQYMPLNINLWKDYYFDH